MRPCPMPSGLPHVLENENETPHLMCVCVCVCMQAGQKLRSHVIIEPNLNRGPLRRLDAEGLFQAQ